MNFNYNICMRVYSIVRRVRHVSYIYIYFIKRSALETREIYTFIADMYVYIYYNIVIRNLYKQKVIYQSTPRAIYSNVAVVCRFPNKLP